MSSLILKSKEHDLFGITKKFRFFFAEVKTLYAFEYLTTRPTAIGSVLAIDSMLQSGIKKVGIGSYLNHDSINWSNKY